MKKTLLTLLAAGCAEQAPPTIDTAPPQSILACTDIEHGGQGCCPGSPILVDTAGNGFELTAPEDGVMFALRPGHYGQWAWTARWGDDSFLVLDVNRNGTIDDGTELFGDSTEQVDAPERNGFAALAVYDLIERGGNADGMIDERDEIWPRLWLWRDADHDGFSAQFELQPAEQVGIRSFSLAYRASVSTDAHGNEFRFISFVDGAAPIGRVVSDVWLRQGTFPPDPGVTAVTDSPGVLDTVRWTCWAWVYAQMESSIPNQHIACDAPGVAGDPIFLTPDAEGRISPKRLVARSATFNEQFAARQVAIDRMLAAYNDGRCFAVARPVPDPFKVATETQAHRGISCTSVVIPSPNPPTGGGGC